MSDFRPWFNVAVTPKGGSEREIGEFREEADAVKSAIETHKRYHGNAYVDVMRDGEPWKYVAVYPKRIQNTEPVMCSQGFCLHPRCGQVHPSSCYCEELDRLS